LVAKDGGVQSAGGQTDHAGFSGALIQPVAHLLLATFEQPDRHARIPLGERPQLRSDKGCRDTWQARQAQRPGDLTCEGGDFCAHQSQMPHRFARVRQGKRTGFGQ
jgi:hypothetical protein